MPRRGGCVETSSVIVNLCRTWRGVRVQYAVPSDGRGERCDACLDFLRDARCWITPAAVVPQFEASMGRARSIRYVDRPPRRSRRASRDAARKHSLSVPCHVPEPPRASTPEPDTGEGPSSQRAGEEGAGSRLATEPAAEDDQGFVSGSDKDGCSIQVPDSVAMEDEVVADVEDADDSSADARDGDSSCGQSSSSLHSTRSGQPRETDPFNIPGDLLTGVPSDGWESQHTALLGALFASDEARDSGGSALLPASSLPMPFKHVEQLYAYLLLRGQCHGTEELYHVLRAGMNIASPVSLPSASTIRCSIAPVVDASWMLQTESFTTRHVPSGKDVSVSYIPPSEHVRRDLAFDDTFALFLKADRRRRIDRELHPEFVDSALFRDRSSILMSGRLVPRFLLAGVQLVAGDRVNASLGDGRLLDGMVVRRAFFAAAATGLARTTDAHAGDFVVECDHVEGVPQSAGLIISRYWCAASLLPMTWHPRDGTIVEILDLSRVDLENVAPAHPGGGAVPDGALPGQPASFSGLRRMTWDHSARESSLVVSLCFYSDGFGARTGKEVTLSGVYMSYLTWLFQDRCSSHAARTVAVTPAGVDSDSVLKAITDDLRLGAREGWLCRCADGTTVRVRADVAFFVGDYLQVSKTSKLMGSAANSPCTLCAYRLHGAPGCRFGLAGSSKSTELMRTTARTTSVCAAVSAWLSNVIE